MKFIDVKKMDVLHRISLPKAALEAVGAKKGEYIGIKFCPGYIRLTTDDSCPYKIRIDELGRIHINKTFCIATFAEEPKEISVFVYKNDIILGMYENLAA